MESVVASGPLRNGANGVEYVTPYYQANQGANSDQINLRWPLAVSGTVILKVRIDDPL